MNRSEKLKTEILKQYKSIRDFSKEIGMSNSTLVSALDRDIGGMSIDKVILICEKLGLDIKTFEKLESTANNKKSVDIVKTNLSDNEKAEIIDKYKFLDNEAKIAVKEMLDFQYNKSQIRKEQASTNEINDTNLKDASLPKEIINVFDEKAIKCILKKIIHDYYQKEPEVINEKDDTKVDISILPEYVQKLVIDVIERLNYTNFNANEDYIEQKTA